jgi:hypothetical protein
MKFLTFLYFCGSFLPSWTRIQPAKIFADPDPKHLVFCQFKMAGQWDWGGVLIIRQANITGALIQCNFTVLCLFRGLRRDNDGFWFLIKKVFFVTKNLRLVPYLELNPDTATAWIQIRI